MVENRTAGRWIGLIAGLGPGATVHYYQQLLNAHEKRERSARLLMAQADMSLVVAAAGRGDRIGMAEHLAGLLRRLADAGAEIGAVPAITPHMCAAELAERSPIPLLNLLEATATEVRRRGLERVALFGTRYVLESRMYGYFADTEVVMPSADEIAAIHDAYFQMATSGAGGESQYRMLRTLAHSLLQRGAQAIVLAGTDLALVFNEQNTDFPYVDCARVHVDALTDWACGTSRGVSETA